MTDERIDLLSPSDEPMLWQVTGEDAGKRLDAYLSEASGLTRSAAVRLIDQGAATINGGTSIKNYRLREGDEVLLLLPDPTPDEAIPQDIPLDVRYEDADLLVVNKPSGMVVHPAPGNPDGTLVNALLYHCGSSLSGIGGVIRPGIVHRIDKDTSGLLVVAKNDAAHLALSAQLKGHHIDRIYFAIVLGNLREDEGTVDAPIGRHPVDRKRMAVLRDPATLSRPAVTHWRVLARGERDGSAFTLLRCALETGRTHQIRVHMASIGHPLLGDPVYGGDGTRFEKCHRSLVSGQCLHAGELHFCHPTTGKRVDVLCPMPPEMRRITELLFPPVEDGEWTKKE